MATSKQTTVSKSTPVKKPRQLKKPKRGKRVRKHLKVVRRPVPNAWTVLRQSLTHIFRHPKLFFGITLVYLVLTIVLVKGFGVTNNVAQLKTALQLTFHGKSGAVSTGLLIFGQLLTSAGNATSSVAGAYQTILLVTVSLALIWALRQTHSDHPPKIGIRDAFYKGLYPLVPLLLVLIVIGIQLIPLIIAGSLYNLVFGNHLAVHWYEQYAWAFGLGLLALWSIYMVSSSVFGLYIVTLPDVRPFQALRSARDLVRYRRWLVVRKVVFLPIAMVILIGLIIVPLIFVWPAVVVWVFLLLSMLSLAVIHSYMYSLYRALL